MPPELHPDAPEFLGVLGQIEVMKGPFLGDLRMARAHYEKALKLAQAQESTDPEAAALLPKIKQALAPAPMAPHLHNPQRNPHQRRGQLQTSEVARSLSTSRG